MDTKAAADLLNRPEKTRWLLHHSRCALNEGFQHEASDIFGLLLQVVFQALQAMGDILMQTFPARRWQRGAGKCQLSGNHLEKRS